MFTENGIEIDPERVNQILRQADVLTIAFALFPERVLFDTRTNETDGPLVAIVEPVASVQDRYHWLGQHRSAFGAPEAFSFFAWPHTVRTLIDQDILASLRERLEDASPDAARVFDEVMSRLRRRELVAIGDAIRGADPWRTLWERDAA
ncbi:MAG: hypothetical protein WD557_07480 [Dehalococcoidia bacterium]